jgi:hypothetical protein
VSEGVFHGMLEKEDNFIEDHCTAVPTENNAKTVQK